MGRVNAYPLLLVNSYNAPCCNPSMPFTPCTIHIPQFQKPSHLVMCTHAHHTASLIIQCIATSLSSAFSSSYGRAVMAALWQEASDTTPVWFGRNWWNSLGKSSFEWWPSWQIMWNTTWERLHLWFVHLFTRERCEPNSTVACSTFCIHFCMRLPCVFYITTCTIYKWTRYTDLLFTSTILYLLKYCI